MKGIVFFLLILSLTSCFGPSKEAQQAKENLLNSSLEEKNENFLSENSSTGETLGSYSRVENISGAGMLEISPISNIAHIAETLDISGKVLSTDVTKITVSFENPTSNFPKDENYVLQTYKPGNQTFLYRAYKKYEVLDQGQNLYKIDAYVGDKIQQSIVLEVFITDPIKKDIPTLGEQIQSSTQTGNFVIYELTSSGVTCENVGDFLSNRYSWYYWNTCRPVVKDESFGLNVLRLDGENYVYEKHYFDTIKNIYSVATLETGTGITREQLPEQNTLFRQKSFPEVAGFDQDFIHYNKN